MSVNSDERILARRRKRKINSHALQRNDTFFVNK